MTEVNEPKPVDKVQKKSGGEVKRKSATRTYSGLDLARTVRNMFKAEYPEMTDGHAMQLAVLLTKAKIKGDIK